MSDSPIERKNLYSEWKCWIEYHYSIAECINVLFVSADLYSLGVRHVSLLGNFFSNRSTPVSLSASSIVWLKAKWCHCYCAVWQDGRRRGWAVPAYCASSSRDASSTATWPSEVRPSLKTRQFFHLDEPKSAFISLKPHNRRSPDHTFDFFFPMYSQFTPWIMIINLTVVLLLGLWLGKFLFDRKKYGQGGRQTNIPSP